MPPASYRICEPPGTAASLQTYSRENELPTAAVVSPIASGTMQRFAYLVWEDRVKSLRQPLAYSFLACTVILIASVAVYAQQIDPKTYSGMKWRLIGPFRGGRVITVAGVP